MPIAARRVGMLFVSASGMATQVNHPTTNACSRVAMAPAIDLISEFRIPHYFFVFQLDLSRSSAKSKRYMIVV